MTTNTPEPTRAPADVRPAAQDDLVAIQALAVDNGMFAPDDMAGFDETLRGYLDGSLGQHRWIVAEGVAGQVTGAAYYAPEPFADRVWNLYFLAVQPHLHRSGIGTTLVAHLEQSLRSAGERVARVLLVETSSTDNYEAARHFYGREGFDQEARIREFYGAGDDKIVFWKSPPQDRQVTAYQRTPLVEKIMRVERRDRTICSRESMACTAGTAASLTGSASMQARLPGQEQEVGRRAVIGEDLKGAADVEVLDGLAQQRVGKVGN